MEVAQSSISAEPETAEAPTEVEPEAADSKRPAPSARAVADRSDAEDTEATPTEATPTEATPTEATPKVRRWPARGDFELPRGEGKGDEDEGASKKKKRRRRKRTRSPRKLKTVWKWSRSGVELHDLAWSPNGKRIVVVQRDVSEQVRKMVAEQHELLGMEAPADLEQPLVGDDGAQRRRDAPRVTVLQPERGLVSVLDFGWEPVFGIDDAQIVYVRQQRPLERYRVRPRDRAGNVVALARLDTKIMRIAAEPAGGHLSDPWLSEDGKIVAFVTHGADPLEQGIDMVDLKTRTRFELLAPAQQQVGPLIQAGRRLLVSRRSRGDFELLDLASSAKNVFSWPPDGVGAHPVYGPAADGGWLAIDGEHLRRRGSAKKSSSSSSHVVRGDIVAVSPTRERLAAAQKRLLSVVDTTSSRAKVLRWRAPGKISDFAWSRDAKRIAVVVSNYHDRWRNRFDRDTLHVLELE